MSEVDNLPQVEAALTAYMSVFDAQVGAASKEVSIALESFGKREIVGQRPKGQKATPNQPPMNRTGNLRRSIRGFTERKGFGMYQAVVGSDMVYARAVEIGDPYNPPSWTQGQKFPYLEPALKKFLSSGLITNILIKHLKGK
jgi:hypothetical protein